MQLLKDLVGATASLLWPVRPRSMAILLAWAGDGADLLDEAHTER